MSKTRRASRRQYSEEKRQGEPPYRSRRSQRLPLSHLPEALQNALQSPYRGTEAFELVHREADLRNVRSRPGHRYPAPQDLERSPKQKIPTNLVLEGLKHETFCHKRKIRREVLFAKRIGGTRGGSPGRRGTYTRNALSQYNCKR